MLLALKDGELIRATPGNRGICPQCDEDVISVCGTINIWHWRHAIGDCIYHTEPETDWHREWKDKALKLGLEIEKDVLEEHIHIADIYDPKSNTVIELQHSPISEIDIINRCSYHSINDMEIKWIFDYTEKYDQGHITKLNNDAFPIRRNIEIKWFNKTIRCMLDKNNIPDYDICLHMTNENIDRLNYPVMSKILKLYESSGISKVQCDLFLFNGICRKEKIGLFDKPIINMYYNDYRYIRNLRNIGLQVIRDDDDDDDTFNVKQYVKDETISSIAAKHSIQVCDKNEEFLDDITISDLDFDSVLKERIDELIKEQQIYDNNNRRITELINQRQKEQKSKLFMYTFICKKCNKTVDKILEPCEAYQMSNKKHDCGNYVEIIDVKELFLDF